MRTISSTQTILFDFINLVIFDEELNYSINSIEGYTEANNTSHIIIIIHFTSEYYYWPITLNYWETVENLS
jgi:hypothetical protein